MQNFEYKVLNLGVFRHGDAGPTSTSPRLEFERQAPELGALGWELVSVAPVAGKPDLIAFFKRSVGIVDPGAVIKVSELMQAAHV